MSTKHGRKRASTWMLLALLPMLTYMGHWPRVTVSLPGEAVMVISPGAHHGPDSLGHSHAPSSAPGPGDDHQEHCHSGVATCTDIPFTGGVTVLNLAEAITGLTANSPRFLALDASERLLLGAAVRLDPRPPRNS